MNYYYYIEYKWKDDENDVWEYAHCTICAKDAKTAKAMFREKHPTIKHFKILFSF